MLAATPGGRIQCRPPLSSSPTGSMEASGASRSFLSLPGEQASRRSSGSRPRRSGRRGGRLTVTGSLCALVPLHLILSARPQLLRLPMASANAISTASLLRPLSQVICARPAGEELRPPHLRRAEELRRPARAWGGASLPCSKGRGASGSRPRWRWQRPPWARGGCGGVQRPPRALLGERRASARRGPARGSEFMAAAARRALIGPLDIG